MCRERPPGRGEETFARVAGIEGRERKEDRVLVDQQFLLEVEIGKELAPHLAARSRREADHLPVRKQIEGDHGEPAVQGVVVILEQELADDLQVRRLVRPRHLSGEALLLERVPDRIPEVDPGLPVAAGIGGGSSDAAAALRAMQALNPAALSLEILLKIAFELGADVPMCLSPRAKFIGGIGEVMAEGKALNVADVQRDPRRLPIDLSINARSLLVAPVESRHRRLGTITVQCARTNAFTVEDEQLLKMLGVQAGIAIG